MTTKLVNKFYYLSGGIMFMETILIEVLKFLGVSTAGGLTWDIIKETGSKLLAVFKKHFVASKYFKDETQAEYFLKCISSKESLNKRNPLEDAWSIYDRCTGEEASDLFKTEFVNWIKQNGEDLIHLGECSESATGIFIQKQINRDNANVTNIGSQYNFGGVRDERGKPDK